ncbi:MAG: hypothetical protein JF597_23045 [Streptomyces sp.]|jgi:hypothetical protein|uniref:hypothetical protein n=1 Tax=Streptomyces sp. TaxID=1931 RepID=UPI0025FDE2E9|nr:hypothetical protein [Streptomyces sp.]MBW8796367.1 hypothetical protein [Streptomyces sp.]
MRTRTFIASLTAALALTLTACSNSDQDSKQTSTASTATAGTSAKGRHYASAQAIVDALNAAGLTASKPQKNTDDGYISQIGGTAYDFSVTDQTAKAKPGSAGINLFPNPEALAAWVPMSKSLGGVSVTGDTWAVSLPTIATGARADSKRLAPKVAAALDGTVQE